MRLVAFQLGSARRSCKGERERVPSRRRVLALESGFASSLILLVGLPSPADNLLLNLQEPKQPSTVWYLFVVYFWPALAEAELPGYLVVCSEANAQTCPATHGFHPRQPSNLQTSSTADPIFRKLPCLPASTSLGRGLRTCQVRSVRSDLRLLCRLTLHLRKELLLAVDGHF